MTYFRDLSEYCYLYSRDASPADFSREPWPDVPLLNVGWMEPGRPMPRASSPSSLVEMIKPWAQIYSINSTRGIYFCGFCQTENVESCVGGGDIPGGSGEFRVRGDRVSYACPNLLPHYIECHGYRPPVEFCEAVLNPVHGLRESSPPATSSRTSLGFSTP